MPFASQVPSLLDSPEASTPPLSIQPRVPPVASRGTDLVLRPAGPAAPSKIPHVTYENMEISWTYHGNIMKYHEISWTYHGHIMKYHEISPVFMDLFHDL